MSGDLAWTVCTACNGSGQIVYGVAASDPSGWQNSKTRHECIPCDGTGRVRQRYPVRA